MVQYELLHWREHPRLPKEISHFGTDDHVKFCRNNSVIEKVFVSSEVVEVIKGLVFCGKLRAGLSHDVSDEWRLLQELKSELVLEKSVGLH